MPIPDMRHQRDPVEIWKLAWDETNQVLRTSASINISGGIEVSINHIDDSISIGDGAGSLRKAGVNSDFELLAHDSKVKTSVDAVNTSVGTSNTRLSTIITNTGNADTKLGSVVTNTGNTDTKLGTMLTKLPYKLGVDYDKSVMTLSVADTVETWTFTLSAAFVFKVVLKYVDSTRDVLTEITHSLTP